MISDVATDGFSGVSDERLFSMLLHLNLHPPTTVTQGWLQKRDEMKKVLVRRYVRAIRVWRGEVSA